MIGFPVFYIIFASLFFELNSRGALSILLSPLFYIASIFWIYTGFGFRKMQKWSWYTCAFAQVFTTYLNAICLLNYSESGIKALLFFWTLLIQFYVHLVARREIRVPYLFPEIRWWESGIAGMTHIQVEVERTEKDKASGQILDISGRGCFLKCPIEFNSFEKIKLQGTFLNHTIDLPGVVVWNARSTVTHPKGVGIKFFGLDRKKKKRLQIMIKRFHKEKGSNRVIKRTG